MLTKIIAKTLTFEQIADEESFSWLSGKTSL